MTENIDPHMTGRPSMPPTREERAKYEAQAQKNMKEAYGVDPIPHYKRGARSHVEGTQGTGRKARPAPKVPNASKLEQEKVAKGRTEK